MSDSKPSSKTQAPQRSAACFYCEEAIEAGAPVVHGVKVIAHKTCVHWKVVRLFQLKYPLRPRVENGHGMVLRALREAGVSEQEVWG